jgi:hypothetical protein
MPSRHWRGDCEESVAWMSPEKGIRLSHVGREYDRTTVPEEDVTAAFSTIGVAQTNVGDVAS